MTNFKLQSFNSDKIGILSSTLCLIHCLALPALISAEPILAEFVPADLIFLEYFFLVVSFIAVYFASKKSSPFLKIVFYGVLSLFTIALLLESSLSWMQYLTYVGSLGLISVHLINYYRNRKCEIPSKTKAKNSSKEIIIKNVYPPVESQAEYTSS